MATARSGSEGKGAVTRRTPAASSMATLRRELTAGYRPGTDGRHAKSHPLNDAEDESDIRILTLFILLPGTQSGGVIHCAIRPHGSCSVCFSLRMNRAGPGTGSGERPKAATDMAATPI